VIGAGFVVAGNPAKIITDIEKYKEKYKILFR
jgi:hypothetical protein